MNKDDKGKKQIIKKTDTPVDNKAYGIFLFGLICSFVLPYSFSLILVSETKPALIAENMIVYYSSLFRYPEFILCGLFLWCLYSKISDIRISLGIVSFCGTFIFLVIKFCLLRQAFFPVSFIVSLLIDAFLVLVSLAFHKTERTFDSEKKENADGIVKLVFWVLLTSYILPFVTDHLVIGPEFDIYSFYDTSTVYMGRYLPEMLFYVLVLSFLIVISGSPFISLAVFMAPYCILTAADAIKYAERSDFMHASDLLIFEAYVPAFRSVRYGSVGHVLLNLFLPAALYLLFTRILFGKSEKYSLPSGIRRIAIPAGALLLVVSSICIFSISSYLELSSLLSADYDSSTSRRFALSKFFERSKNSTGLSDAESAENYFDTLYQDTDDRTRKEIRPNVIVIMNESWWNTDNIKWADSSVSVSADPMEPVKELLDENCSMGYVNVNAFGGGTLHSEMEFLTGMNSKYLNKGDGLYKTMGSEEYPSVNDYFKALGYRTVAMHPGDAGYYGRITAYEQMGFDRIIFEDDFTEREKYFAFISDESVMKEIIHEYDAGKVSSGAPEFIWAITIANHSHILVPVSDEDKKMDFPIDVSFENDRLNDEEKGMVHDYINGIYLANRSFAMLTDHFKETDEPTVILMFGDHCPQFSKKVLREFGIPGTDDTDTLERLYTTPVIIWSNIEGFDYSPSGESVPLMMANVLSRSGLPDSEMIRILLTAGEKIKADTKYITLSGSGDRIDGVDTESRDMILNLHSIGYAFLNSDPAVQDIWMPLD